MSSQSPRSSLEAEHTPAAVRRRLDRRPSPSYLRDFIYGAIDGTITTFAVVAGVEGASLDATIVIILGAANLLADGFSMAASNFLGSRAGEAVFTPAMMKPERLQHIEGWNRAVRATLAWPGDM